MLVSWLPLYHDMGLVGCMTTPMTTGAGLVLASPQDFLAHPGAWMEWISTYRGTATAGPNFSWVLATRALKRMSGLDLSSMRIALNGAEPIDPDAVEAFVAAAAPHGFRPGAEFCAFGMAEVAIAGTFPPPMRGMVCDVVDRRGARDRARREAGRPDDEGARRLPLLGKPVPGLEIRICDQKTGAVLREREVGELEISGTSVTPGYYKRPDATAELFRDGWLRTGDLAYMLDGELVLCGRIKDVIIIGGRNLFPEDIERAIGTMDGVRAGNVDRLRRRRLQGQGIGRRRRRDASRRRRSRAQGGAPACARGRGRAAPRRDARRGRHDAEDVVRQAAAQPVQAALPRRVAAARLTHAVALRGRMRWSSSRVDERAPRA